MESKPKFVNKSLSLNVLKTPFCGDLRSKKYYLRDQIPTTAEDFYDSTRHTWCYHTQMAVGPDGEHATPETCGPERSCYRSALAKPAAYAIIPGSRINGRLV